MSVRLPASNNAQTTRQIWTKLSMRDPEQYLMEPFFYFCLVSFTEGRK